MLTAALKAWQGKGKGPPVKWWLPTFFLLPVKDKVRAETTQACNLTCGSSGSFSLLCIPVITVAPYLHHGAKRTHFSAANIFKFCCPSCTIHDTGIKVRNLEEVLRSTCWWFFYFEFKIFCWRRKPLKIQTWRGWKYSCKAVSWSQGNDNHGRECLIWY